MLIIGFNSLDPLPVVTLRQHSMTYTVTVYQANFYQVNPSQPIHYISQYQPNSQTISDALNQSQFILSPYIKPESPYLSLPITIPKQARHIRQQNTYNDIAGLDSTAMAEFINGYQSFKHPRFGSNNPTNLTNPYYDWVTKYRLSAWDIQKNIIDLAIQTNEQEGRQQTPPLWCFERIGQSKTVLSDGRIVFIGGEYEDYYDPDFYIYNDVTVIHPDGAIETYSYPKSVFPPTDFHSATLVTNPDDEHIIIIGSIGYPDDRQYSHTPVYKLDTQTFRITQVATRNSMGWISGHTAILQDNRIVVSGGELLVNDLAPLLDNIDTWVLNLNTLIWKNVTHNDKKWQRFYITRQDGGYLHLWEYQQLSGYLQEGVEAKVAEYTQLVKKGTNQAPTMTNVEGYRQLLVPPVAHEVVATADKLECPCTYDAILIIDSIKVGYKMSNDSCIQVTIEGKLSDDIVELIQQNLRHKLSKVENMACEVIAV